MCGKEFLGNVVLVTTAGDPDSAQGQRWIEKLRMDDLYWKPFLHYGARVARFEESFTSASKVLQELEGHRALPLLIQQELSKKRIEETTMWSIVRKCSPMINRRPPDNFHLNKDDLIIL